MASQIDATTKRMLVDTLRLNVHVMDTIYSCVEIYMYV